MRSMIMCPSYCWNRSINDPPAASDARQPFSHSSLIFVTNIVSESVESSLIPVLDNATSAYAMEESALEYVTKRVAEAPNASVSAAMTTISDLYKKKLWHQLTEVRHSLPLRSPICCTNRNPHSSTLTTIHATPPCRAYHRPFLVGRTAAYQGRCARRVHPGQARAL